MNKTVFSIIFLGFLLLGKPSIAQGYLHTEGTEICNGRGEPVLLRGIGTGNWMLQEGYMMMTSELGGTQHEFRNRLIKTIGEAKTDSFYNVWLKNHFKRSDVDSLKSWGFNTVRVAMHYKWFTPPIEEEPVAGKITWNEKGFQMLDSLLDWCGENQMYLVLDLHGAPGGQGKDANISDYDPTKPSLWESELNKEKTVALWGRLAERYAEEPWIGGYDLINETNWTFPEGNNSQLRDLYGRITDTIRAVDNNHIIFIEGNAFANDFSGLTPPWDENMVYSFHKYWNYNIQDAISWVLELREKYNIPIWLGETGENSNTWFTNLVELCEKNNIGWSWWPVKKHRVNNPLRVIVNKDYLNLIEFWKGEGPAMTEKEAFLAVLNFADNHKTENCVVQRDVIDALIRQPHTTETIPFTAHTIDDRIYFTDYDLGRNKYAYFDRDTANHYLEEGKERVIWNKGWAYRNDGVDIGISDDIFGETNGFYVGWTEPGEWMQYTLTVDETAKYTLTIRYANSTSDAAFHFENEEKTVTDMIVLPSQSTPDKWNTIKISGVTLEKGVHKLRCFIDKGGAELNYFSFTRYEDEK